MASLKQLTAGGSCREVSKFTCMSVCSSFFRKSSVWNESMEVIWDNSGSVSLA